MKKIIIDLDGTLTTGKTTDYSRATPNEQVIKTLREYANKGFEIVIHTARNMRTHKGNVGKINVHTLPIIMEWLDRHGVPHDEIIVGKPWCGKEGFYVDDRALRPSEFAQLTPEEIKVLLDKENPCS
ncbi:MAG: HAD hydrolase family protein [Desulfovibrionales bacterium]|nr:HAD hydrolase family protein [Desulfovibrionales bacterium]